MRDEGKTDALSGHTKREPNEGRDVGYPILLQLDSAVGAGIGNSPKETLTFLGANKAGAARGFEPEMPITIPAFRSLRCVSVIGLDLRERVARIAPTPLVFGKDAVIDKLIDVA
jgi:hypothetical protein